jgi:hypothetical protein
MSQPRKVTQEAIDALENLYPLYRGIGSMSLRPTTGRSSMSSRTGTGHVSQLNRPGIVEPHRFGTERYSRKGLTADMGAAFLCAMTGTDLSVLANQAAYIAG